MVSDRFPFGIFYTYDADSETAVVWAIIDLRLDPDWINQRLDPQVEVWTASRQKWQFEEARAMFFLGGVAVRCRDCRNKRRGSSEVEQDGESG